MSFLNKLKSAVSKKTAVVNVYAPVDGEIVKLEKVPDEAFSSGMLGQGLAIKPTHNSFVAFMDGVLEVVFDTGHAFIIRDPKTEINVLLHIGVDTVNIPAERKVFKKTDLTQGTTVKTGTFLCQADMVNLRKLAKSDLVMVLVQNENLDRFRVDLVKTGGAVKKGELLLVVRK